MVRFPHKDFKDTGAMERLKDPNYMPTQADMDEVSMQLLGFTAHEFIYGVPKVVKKRPDGAAIARANMAKARGEELTKEMREALGEEVEPVTTSSASEEPPAASERSKESSLDGPLPLKSWISEHGVKHFQDIILAYGTPAREDWSLFSHDDPVLKRAQSNRAPYHKHLLSKTEDGKFTFKPTTNGWTIGANAARSGFEYRAFFEVGTAQKKTFGAARFSDSARADANGFDDYIHGGAIQTLLDEATAECSMIKACVLPTTAEASFKIMKKVVPNKTYLFECEITEEVVKGVKYKVIGKLINPDDNTTNAQCTAMIANIGAIPQARKDRYGE